MYKILNMDPKWIKFPVDKYVRAYNRYKGLEDKELRGLIDELCTHFPHPGRLWKSEIMVMVEKGRRKDTHTHVQHTIVYYIQMGEPVCAIIVNDERIEMKVGQAIYIAPGTPHSVEPNQSTTTRISLGLLWIQK